MPGIEGSVFGNDGELRLVMEMARFCLLQEAQKCQFAVRGRVILDRRGETAEVAKRDVKGCAK